MGPKKDGWSHVVVDVPNPWQSMEHPCLYLYNPAWWFVVAEVEWKKAPQSGPFALEITEYATSITED